MDDGSLSNTKNLWYRFVLAFDTKSNQAKCHRFINSFRQPVFQILFTFIICLLSLNILGKDGEGHIWDALKIMFEANTKQDPRVHALVAYISQGMDYGKTYGSTNIAGEGSAFLKTIRVEFGAEGYKLTGLGSHHYFAHWNFNDPIPNEMIEKIGLLSEQGHLPPDAVNRFTYRWRQFVFSRTQAVKQVFNLSGEGSDKVARTVAALVDDIHNLGDWAFDKDVKGLRDVNSVVRNYLKCCNRILGHHNGLVQNIKYEIEHLPKLAPKEHASEVLKILEKHRGDMYRRLNNILSRYGFKEEIGALDYEALEKSTAMLELRETIVSTADDFADDLSANLKIGKRFTTNPIKGYYDKNIAKVSEKIAHRLNTSLERVYTKDPKLAEVLKKKGCTGVKTTTGILQSITLKDGQTVNVLHIPVENVSRGLTAGMTAGVMTFIFSESATGYCYFKGNISKEKFLLESAKNCSAALLGGGATFVGVVLGASPGGPIVLGVGIGTYLLCDIAFQRLERVIDYQHFHIEDMLGEFPIEFQRRKSTLEYDGYESLLEYEGGETLIDFKHLPSPLLDWTHSEESLLEPTTKRKSLLEQ